MPEGQESSPRVMTRRRAIKLVVGAAAGVAASGSLMPEATPVIGSLPNPGRLLLQITAGLQINREEDLESLRERGIRVSDKLPAKVAHKNSLHFTAIPWENRRIAAFKNAVDSLPPWWWEEIQKQGGLDVFLFPHNNQKEHGMVVPPWNVDPYAMAFSESIMDTSPGFGQFGATVSVAHETTHLLTWATKQEKDYWQNFVTSSEGLNLTTDADGIIIKGKDTIGLVGYGNSSIREFLAVASSLYLTGRQSFTDAYGSFLSPEQTEKLYQQLKRKIYRSIEYNDDPLKLKRLNEFFLKNIPRMHPQEYLKYLEPLNNLE